MIDAARVKEWAEHDCARFDCHDREEHAERRELAQRLIAETKLTNVANKWREEQSERAKKAEAARDVLAAALGHMLRGVHLPMTSNGCGGCLEALATLDAHAPGWRDR